MVDLFLASFVGLFAGLMAGTLLLPWSKQPGLKQRLNALGVSAFVGFIGAILVYFIGEAIPALGLYQGGDFLPWSIGAVVAVLILAGVQSFRQNRRDADERAGGRAEAPAAEKAAPEQTTLDKLAAVSRSAPAKRAKRIRRIFISYRREADAALAGRIADLLKNEFGEDHVFMDVDAMRLGFDFVEIINEEVAKCDVLLAVMGRNWLDAQSDDGKRRLDNAADYVRIEIAAALKRQIPVIPILVDGTKIPPADRLPEELKELERRNALDLRNASFRADMDKLVRELKPPESAFGEFMTGFFRGLGGY